MTERITNKKTVIYVVTVCRRIDREVSQKTKEEKIIEVNTAAAVMSAIKIKDAALSTLGGAHRYVKS